MRSDRQLWRLMAAMIAMIIVYAAPTAVQAHEGHAHHGSHHAVVEQEQVMPPAVVKAPEGKAFASMPSSLHEPATPSVADPQGSIVGLVASSLTVDDGTGSCPGDAGGPCCGKKACCSPGILSGPAELPVIPFRQSSVVPGDMIGRLGSGPGALPEPPRTLA